MRRKPVIRAAVFAAWFAVAFWFVRTEAFPELFSHALAGYDGLLGRDTLIADTWMRILQDGRPVGYCRASTDVNEYDSLRHVVMETRVFVRLPVLGATHKLSAGGTAYLDMLYQLQQFEFHMSADPIQIRVTGERTTGRRFRVLIDNSGTRTRMTVEIPDDAILQSPMTALAVKRLRVGDRVRVRTLNPLTLTPAEATIRALRREPVTLGGATRNALVLATDYMGASLRSWVGDDGALLRQETALGWTLEACSAEEALTSGRGDREERAK